VPLPNTIPVRFTEEDADNFTIRPVKRQTFRPPELLDMILRVTGKDPARVQQILHSGTIVYHFYRYWWQSLDLSAEELAAALANFPSDDPTRPFRANECSAVTLESAPSAHRIVEITRESAGRKPLFSSASLWDRLMSLGASAAPQYSAYSFERAADLYHLALTPDIGAAIVRESLRLAPRNLRTQLEHLGPAARITFTCPRAHGSAGAQ
jgi:hypothetical protein